MLSAVLVLVLTPRFQGSTAGISWLVTDKGLASRELRLENEKKAAMVDYLVGAVGMVLMAYGCNF